MNDDLKAVHELALKRFNKIQDREDDQRSLAVEDLRFAHAEDGQWDDAALEKRKDRPRYTINRVAPALDQLAGDQRQTRTSIKIIPESGGAKEDKADIFNGLIRNIESRSKASDAYDLGFDEVVACGYGGWRVVTDYSTDDSFEQDIRIEPIVGAATSLWFDPAAQRYDRSDAMYAFLTTDIEPEDFKESFPEAQKSPIPQNQYSAKWFDNETVKVAEYWVKTPVKKTIALLSDGRVIDKDEEAAVLDELDAQGITISKERSVEGYKVQMYLISGSEILEGPMEWAGKHIPLIPLYGKSICIEGEWHIRGLVRFAKDAQRIYNYATSAAIEASALTPKDPIWITATQAEGHEDRLKNFNVRNDPFMLYNADPQAPGAPQRTGAPSVQTALIQQIQQAAIDIHGTTGIEPASLGNSPELKSGKALLAQQAMGDRGSFVFSDNLASSIEYTGQILVDIIPKIYDTERVIRVMGADGSTDEVSINAKAIDEFNQPIIDEQTGKQVIVNDLTIGKYDVVVETGPAFNTLRQESAQQLIELANGNEVFGQVAIDLIAKNLNILENDELTKRVRKLMIQQGIVDPTEDEVKEYGLDQPQRPDPSTEALTTNINMQTEKLMSDIEIQEAEQERKMVETSAKVERDMADLIQKQEKWMDEFALKITQLEQTEKRDLNREVAANRTN